ncbi:class I SAM-dependent methyltransferase [Celeribacter neptunius]|nr:class I SAM-dependent methyltransferase [Celeribacter neptunius]
MASSPLFWNLIARKYLASPVPDEAVYQRKLELTRERLRPDWDLLEIGCGSGATALNHAPHVRSVTACDFSKKLLAVGETRAAAEQIDNVTFHCKSLDEITAPPAYDAVLMLSLLHLLPDWRGAIDRAAALTKPGGIFVSSTTCMGHSRLLRLLQPLLRLLPLLPSVTAFTEEALRAEIRANGFDIEVDWRPEGADALFLIARRQG